MGKDLRGKELGVGICQTKDKKYVGRITSTSGKRIKRVFDKLSDCRKWIAEARYTEEHGRIASSGDMSVAAWFDYWIQEIKGKTVKPNTIRNYTERFNHNIKPLIGHMMLKDVKPLHCQNILNQMVERYCKSTINQAKITMYVLFDSAVENELILRNPVTKAVKCNSGKESKQIRVLTNEEQYVFLKSVKGSSVYNQYALILQTGLRTGELIGLRWSDIDFDKKILHVRRTMEYRYSVGEWRVGDPKSKSGFRDIPLTQEAIAILKNQKEKNIIPSDSIFTDLVFLSRNGEPIKNSSYDTRLNYYCDKAGIPRIHMHTLRHSFATRCIEGGIRPKSLQTILGHSQLSITMNLYVHVTEDEKVKEMENIEKALSFAI